METSIKQGIKQILEGVNSVKQVFLYPGIPTKYPAVICLSDNMENSFADTKNNFKVYKFKIWIEVSVAGTTEDNVFESVLPSVSDQVISAFDTAWNGGTYDGHRIWQVISGGFEGFVVNEKSKTGFKELTLVVKVMTSN